jgi:hypothetical protein
MRRRTRQLTMVLILVVGLMATAWPATAQRLPGNVCATLQATRANYSPYSPDKLAAWLNEVAWIHRAEGWGLNAKPAGNNCPMANGTLVACDILHRRSDNLIWDVVQGAGDPGVSNAVCGDALGPANDPNRPWVVPVDPGGGGPIEPPGGDLDARLKAIEASLARIETTTTRTDAQVKAIGDATAEILAILRQPPVPATCTVNWAVTPWPDYVTPSGSFLKVVLKPVPKK